ncbi:MAG: L-threonylcarbamoyladenylate synthase [Patescibacteria group bacterium]
METLSINDLAAVAKAADVLARGGVILYPTDTLYGLGADALSDEAVAKVRAIKGRDEKKPIHAIVADLGMAAKYAEVSEAARKLAQKFLPGPLTLILKKKSGIEASIAKGMDTFSIRIPDNQFCLDLAKAFGKPFTTTSANTAGMQPERSVKKILTQLGENAQRIDLVIDAGELPKRQPSTVVDVSSGEVKVLREGAIPASQLLQTS